ncbi:anthranilate synthase component II [Natronospora cellulosivora (SeqCode)]
MILVIDNYDSFTYNLYQYLAEMKEVVVYRNDKIKIEEIEEMSPEYIVISPGPGRPEDAGISREIIQHFKGKIPILGVCLGHQCIADVFGANIVKAKNILHGKRSLIQAKHNDKRIFKDITFPFMATRYHSLIVEVETVPEELEVLAVTDENEIMAIKHKDYDIYGLQFHPESILSENGFELLSNFLSI